MYRLVGALVIALALPACTGTTAKNGDHLESGWQAFNAYADGLTTEPLNSEHLPKAPKGFNDQQVKIFADASIKLLKRSVSEEVATLKPDVAITYVTKGLFTSTVYSLRNDAAYVYGDNNWQWKSASLLGQKPSEPARVVKVLWDASSRPGEYDDGTPARVLDLILQAHVVQTIGTGADRRTFIVRRTIQLSGYKPGGGRDWWPYLSVDTAPYGNQGCALYSTGRLVPITNATELSSDLAAAKVSIAEKEVIETSDATAEDVSAFASECKKKVDKQ